MNIFFDVDYTILSMDGALRPGTRELFARLVAEGHTVYVWSGVGLRWEVVREFDLEPYVSGVFVKPTYSYTSRLGELGVNVPVDFVVDDTIEVIYAFGGHLAEPWVFGDRDDDEVPRIYEAIAAHAAKLEPSFEQASDVSAAGQ